MHPVVNAPHLKTDAVTFDRGEVNAASQALPMNPSSADRGKQDYAEFRLVSEWGCYAPNPTVVFHALCDVSSLPPFSPPLWTNDRPCCLLRSFPRSVRDLQLKGPRAHRGRLQGSSPQLVPIGRYYLDHCGFRRYFLDRHCHCHRWSPEVAVGVRAVLVAVQVDV